MWPFSVNEIDPIEVHKQDVERLRQRTDALIPDPPGAEALINRFGGLHISDFYHDVAKLLTAQQAEIEKLKRRVKRLEDATS